MKYGKLIALAGLAFVACGELSGTLTLQRALNVVDKKGRTQQISSGSFRSEFEYDQDKRRIKLKVLKAAQGSGKDVEMEILVPAGSDVPRENGPFVLRGAEIGQQFDLKGNLNTDIRETSPTRTTEQCTYTDTQYVCRRVCYDRVGRDGKRYQECQRECRNENVTRYGRRDVEYHNVTTTITVLADLAESSSQELLGKLNVGRQDSRLVYDYYGSCMR